MLCDDLECESALREISVTRQRPPTDDSAMGVKSSGQSTAARLRPTVSAIVTVTPDRLTSGLGVRIARKRSPVTLSFLSPLVARPADGLVDEPAVPIRSRSSLVQAGDRGASCLSVTPAERPGRTEQSGGLVPPAGIDSRDAVRTVTDGADSAGAAVRQSLERSGSTSERRPRRQERRSQLFVTHSTVTSDLADRSVALAMESRRSTAMSETTTASGRCSSAGNSLERGTLSLLTSGQPVSQGLAAPMTADRLDRSACESNSSPSLVRRTAPASRVVERPDTTIGFTRYQTGNRIGGTNPSVRPERAKTQRTVVDSHGKERGRRAVTDLSGAMARQRTVGVSHAGVSDRRDRVEYQRMRLFDRSTLNQPRLRRNDRIRDTVDPDLVYADDGSRVRSRVRSTTQDQLDPAHGRLQAIDSGPAESAELAGAITERWRSDAALVRNDMARLHSSLSRRRSVPVTTVSDRIQRPFPEMLTASPSPHTERFTTTGARRTTTQHPPSQPTMQLWLPHDGLESHESSGHSQLSVATSRRRDQPDLTVQVASPIAAPSRANGSSSFNSGVVPSERADQNTVVAVSAVSKIRRDFENTRRPGTHLSRSQAEGVSPDRASRSHGSSAMRSTRARPSTHLGSLRTIAGTHSSVAEQDTERAVAVRLSGRSLTAAGSLTDSSRRHASVPVSESGPASRFRGVDGPESRAPHRDSATMSAQCDRSGSTELASAYRVSVGTPHLRRAAPGDRSAVVRPQPRVKASSPVSRHEPVPVQDSRNGSDSSGNARSISRTITATVAERNSSWPQRERAGETHTAMDDVRPRESGVAPRSAVAPISVVSLRAESAANTSPVTAAVARGNHDDRLVRVDGHSRNLSDRTPVPVSSPTTAMSVPRAIADPSQTAHSGPFAVTNLHRHRSAAARLCPHTDRGRPDSAGRRVPFRERTRDESGTGRATDRSTRIARPSAASILRPLAVGTPVGPSSARPSAHLWPVGSTAMEKSFSPRNRLSVSTGIGAGSAEWSDQRDDAVRSPEAAVSVQQPTRSMTVIGRPGMPSLQADASQAEPASSSAVCFDSSWGHVVTTLGGIDGHARTDDSRSATATSPVTSIRPLTANGAVFGSRRLRSRIRVRRQSSTVLSAVDQNGSLHGTELGNRSTDIQSLPLHTRDAESKLAVPAADPSPLEQSPGINRLHKNKINSNIIKSKMEDTGATEMEMNVTSGRPSLTYRTTSGTESPTAFFREPRTQRSSQGRRQGQQRHQELDHKTTERPSERRDRTQAVPRSGLEPVSESTHQGPSVDRDVGRPGLNDRRRPSIEHGASRSEPPGFVPDSDRHRRDRFDGIDVPSDTDPRFDADVDRAVEELYRKLERKIRIERDRRGL